MILDSPIITGSLVVSGSIQIEGQPAGTIPSASYVETAQTASYIETAQTASYVTTAQTASYVTASNIEGLPPSDPFPYTGSAIISGSLNVIGDLLQNGAALETDPFPYSGSAIISGSQEISGSVEFSHFSTAVGTAVWSAGGALINARYGLGAAGISNAGLAFGGYDGYFNRTEEYDGSSWTSGGALINGRTRASGTGTQNAGLAAGGWYGFSGITSTEEYDGSSWSAGGSMIAARCPVTVGTQNAGLAIGGSNGDPNDGPNQWCTEEYNGASWATGNVTNQAVSFHAGAGTQNAAIKYGGQNFNGAFPSPSVYGGPFTCTEEYDGTSWSTGGALITATHQQSGAGSQDNAHSIGGSASSTTVENYNGSSWSTAASLSNGGTYTGGAGTTTGFVTGGNNPAVTCTEEYSLSGGFTKSFDYSSTTGETSGSFIGSFSGNSSTISGSLQTTGSVGFSYFDITGGTAVWSAGGAMITGRACLSGAGTQNAGLAIGGCIDDGPPPTINCTEEYNGTSWSAGGALSYPYHGISGGSAGTQNAALHWGGGDGLDSCCTEEYNGTSWSAGGALITKMSKQAGMGTQNAALSAGGQYYLPLDCTEEYNGTSWASGGALSTAKYGLAGAGTQNAGLAFGGHYPTTSATEEYNGTSWSAGGALITARYFLAGAGTQDAGLGFGGRTPSIVSCTEEYDGSSWSAGSALITGRCALGGAGTQSSGLAMGGFASPTCVSCTEEYSPGGGFTKSFDYSSTTGETTVSCLIETSAERYKDNIQPMGSQLNKLMQLQPVEFDWKSNRKHDIGFVADSVKNIYPNLVSEKDGQVEGMNYSKLVSALVKSIQEQQTQIDDLKSRLDNNN